MSRDPTGSTGDDVSVDRRSMLRLVGTGSAAAAGFGAPAAAHTGEAGTLDVQELSGKAKRRRTKSIRKSDLYRTYKTEFAKTAAVRNFAIRQRDVEVYEVTRGGDRGHVAAFDVHVRAELESGVRIDTMAGDWEGSLLVNDSVGTDDPEATVVCERVTETGDTLTIERRKLGLVGGDLEVGGSTCELAATDGSVELRSHESVNDQVVRSFWFHDTVSECRVCRELFDALCGIGCSVSAGVPCAIVACSVSACTLAIACPAIVGSICYVFSSELTNGCLPSDVTPRSACADIGYC